ncbi:hypothetical protein AWB71_04198 [Caballeronia peredens]|nr:hypothetical protein AWB71_04198 [Caballeronia peredens]
MVAFRPIAVLLPQAPLPVAFEFTPIAILPPFPVAPPDAVWTAWAFAPMAIEPLPERPDVAVATAPAPRATEAVWIADPLLAVALLPMATEESLEATARGPIAVAFTPLADESSSVELVRKYLMPAPLLMLVMLVLSLPSAASTVLNPLPTFVAAPEVPAMLLALVSA